MESNSTAILIKIKLRHSLGRPSRSDFVQSVIFNTLIITLFSILAEIIQFVFSVGVADIDDVILNSIGGCCGVILWKLLFWVFRDRTQFVIDIVAPIGGVLAFLIIYLVNR